MTSNLVQLSDRVLADVVRSRLSSVRPCNTSESNGQHQLAMGNDRSLRKLLTVREVALALHCHPETIYRQIKTVDLPAKRHGKRWKFDPVEVTEWLAQRRAHEKAHRHAE